MGIELSEKNIGSICRPRWYQYEKNLVSSSWSKRLRLERRVYRGVLCSLMAHSLPSYDGCYVCLTIQIDSRRMAINGRQNLLIPLTINFRCIYCIHRTIDLSSASLGRRSETYLLFLY